jgi:tetratricopeptide (TPR) repeat protein
MPDVPSVLPSCMSTCFLFFKARCQNNIAIIFAKQGRRRKALKIMESTLPIIREYLPSTHPDIAALHINIATIYDSIGDYSSALNNYQSCLQIQNVSLSAHHPDLTRTKHYMKWSTAHIQQREALSKHVSKCSIFQLSCYLLAS